MITRADACRQKVAECDRLACSAGDAKIRESYRDISRMWHEMANKPRHLNATNSLQEALEFKLRRCRGTANAGVSVSPGLTYAATARPVSIAERTTIGTTRRSLE
jgi:hypothetical protein